jgi:hypothetical protein
LEHQNYHAYRVTLNLIDKVGIHRFFELIDSWKQNKSNVYCASLIHVSESRMSRIRIALCSFSPKEEVLELISDYIKTQESKITTVKNKIMELNQYENNLRLIVGKQSTDHRK